MTRKPRRRRSELEELVAKVALNSVKELTPGLRDAVRAALDNGATPAEIRRRYGYKSCPSGPGSTTAMSVEWIVDEWERDNGLVKPDESIDSIE